MKYPLYLLTLFILGSTAFPVHAQQHKVDRTSRHDHSVYKSIDRAYEQDKLTIDQKVLYKFYAIKNPNKLPSEYQAQKGKPLKCGTPAIIDFHKNRSRLSKASISEIESLMSTPTAQASETHTSESGRFVIHYETSGEHAVPSEDDNNDGTPDYVEKVATSADSSYRHQVQNLGYSNPISSGDTYHVEIRNLEYIYGKTGAPSPYGGETYIRIENDFAENFPPNDHPQDDQTGAIYATMAHEFKHSVQYEATQWQGESDSWTEMDATLMEEVVYDNVNDYYNYISSENFSPIFLNPETSFYPGSYEHVSWALYFEEKFGSQFWVDVWDTIAEDPSDISMVEAITNQLGTANDFSENFIESQLWHYASGPNNAPPAYGFEESEAYPNPTINHFFNGSDSVQIADNQADQLRPFSAQYVEVTPSSFTGFVAFELSDITVPTDNSGSKIGLAALAYFKDGTTEPLILYSENQSSLTYQTTWAWEELEKVGIVVVNGNQQDNRSGYRLFVRTEEPQVVQLRQNYPNPFNEQTIIPYNIPQREHVKLQVFDILGRKVATLIDQIQPRGIYRETLHASDFASGVYFYRLRTSQKVLSEKMTIIK